MYDYIAPLLRKKPTVIILHIGSNDSLDKTLNTIMNDILKRLYIEVSLPTATVYLSCPILRLDHAKARFTLNNLNNKMKSLENVIVNEHIDGSCLGKAGLHLNFRSSVRLAITTYL